MPDPTETTNQTEPPADLVEHLACAMHADGYPEHGLVWPDLTAPRFRRYARAAIAALPAAAVRLAPQSEPEPALAQTFPFGEFLDEELTARKIPRRMLRRPLGLNLSEIDDLIEGRRELTQELAARLGRFLGTSSELWLNLNHIHQAAELSRLQADMRIRQHALADVLGIPRHEDPTSYYTNIEVVSILRKNLGRARRDLEEAKADRDSLLDHRARFRELWEHSQYTDAIRHLGYEPDQAGTGDTAQPGETLLARLEEACIGTEIADDTRKMIGHWFALGAAPTKWRQHLQSRCGGLALLAHNLPGIVEPWLVSAGLLTARPCPSTATAAPVVSLNAGIADTAARSDTQDSEQHVVDLRENGWTIQHPLSCRPNLFDCPVNSAAEVQLTEPPGELGRFTCGLAEDGELIIGALVDEPARQEPGQEIPDPWANPLPSTWVEELPLARQELGQGNGDAEDERFHVGQRVEYAGEEELLVGTIARVSDKHEEALVYDDETHWSRWISLDDLRPATEAKGQDGEGES